MFEPPSYGLAFKLGPDGRASAAAGLKSSVQPALALALPPGRVVQGCEGTVRWQPDPRGAVGRPAHFAAASLTEEWLVNYHVAVSSLEGADALCEVVLPHSPSKLCFDLTFDSALAPTCLPGVVDDVSFFRAALEAALGAAAKVAEELGAPRLTPEDLGAEVLVGSSGALGKRYRVVLCGLVTADARARAQVLELLRAHLQAVPEGVISYAAALADDARIFLPRNGAGADRWEPVGHEFVQAIKDGELPDRLEEADLTLDELERFTLTCIQEARVKHRLCVAGGSDVDVQLAALLAKCPALKGIAAMPGSVTHAGTSYEFRAAGPYECPCAHREHEAGTPCELDLSNPRCIVFRCHAPARQMLGELEVLEHAEAPAAGTRKRGETAWVPSGTMVPVTSSAECCGETVVAFRAPALFTVPLNSSPPPEARGDGRGLCCANIRRWLQATPFGGGYGNATVVIFRDQEAVGKTHAAKVFWRDEVAGKARIPTLVWLAAKVALVQSTWKELIAYFGGGWVHYKPLETGIAATREELQGASSVACTNSAAKFQAASGRATLDGLTVDELEESLSQICRQRDGRLIFDALARTIERARRVCILDANSDYCTRQLLLAAGVGSVHVTETAGVFPYSGQRHTFWFEEHKTETEFVCVIAARHLAAGRSVHLVCSTLNDVLLFQECFAAGGPGLEAMGGLQPTVCAIHGKVGDAAKAQLLDVFTAKEPPSVPAITISNTAVSGGVSNTTYDAVVVAVNPWVASAETHVQMAMRCRRAKTVDWVFCPAIARANGLAVTARRVDVKAASAEMQAFVRGRTLATDSQADAIALLKSASFRSLAGLPGGTVPVGPRHVPCDGEPWYFTSKQGQWWQLVQDKPKPLVSREEVLRGIRDGDRHKAAIQRARDATSALEVVHLAQGVRLGQEDDPFTNVVVHHALEKRNREAFMVHRIRLLLERKYPAGAAPIEVKLVADELPRLAVPEREFLTHAQERRASVAVVRAIREARFYAERVEPGLPGSLFESDQALYQWLVEDIKATTPTAAGRRSRGGAAEGGGRGAAGTATAAAAEGNGGEGAAAEGEEDVEGHEREARDLDDAGRELELKKVTCHLVLGFGRPFVRQIAGELLTEQSSDDAVRKSQEKWLRKMAGLWKKMRDDQEVGRLFRAWVQAQSARLECTSSREFVERLVAAARTKAPGWREHGTVDALLRLSVVHELLAAAFPQSAWPNCGLYATKHAAAVSNVPEEAEQFGRLREAVRKVKPRTQGGNKLMDSVVAFVESKRIGVSVVSQRPSEGAAMVYSVELDRLSGFVARIEDPADPTLEVCTRYASVWREALGGDERRGRLPEELIDTLWHTNYETSRAHRRRRPSQPPGTLVRPGSRARHAHPFPRARQSLRRMRCICRCRRSRMPSPAGAAARAPWSASPR